MFASPLFIVQIDLASSYWAVGLKSSLAIGEFRLSQEIVVSAMVAPDWPGKNVVHIT